MSRRDVPIAKPPSSGGTLTIYDRHGDKRAEVAAGDDVGFKLGHHEIALSGIEMRAAQFRHAE